MFNRLNQLWLRLRIRWNELNLQMLAEQEANAAAGLSELCKERVNLQSALKDLQSHG